MSRKKNKAVVLREIDFWNGHDADKAGEVYTADYAGHEPGGIHDGTLAQITEAARATFTAFPDMHLTADAFIAEGDLVVKRWTVHGTHKGEFMGIPPTGKKIVVTGTNVLRIAEGMVAECWAQTNTLGMLQQLGVIPPLGG